MLHGPQDFTLRWRSDELTFQAVQRFVEHSPERTVYHSPAYMSWAKAQNGNGDVLMLERNGNALLALPVHHSGNRVTTGYSGVLFPEGNREGKLRRSAEALAALTAANPHLSFQFLQSAQAAGTFDGSRVNTIGWLMEEMGFISSSTFSRVISLDILSSEELESKLFSGYDPDLRNQVRQARKKSLGAEVIVVDADNRDAVYQRFEVIHRESWTRTGMRPHDLAYLTSLSEAVREGEGIDLVCFVHDGVHDLAVVNCHLHGDTALYWAGGSTSAGLKVRANPLALHSAILAAREAGGKHFELGRFYAETTSKKEAAILRYKAQFGGRIVRINHFSTQQRARLRLRRAVSRRLPNRLLSRPAGR